MSLSFNILTVPWVATHSSALPTPTAALCSSCPILQRNLVRLQKLLRLEVNFHLGYLNDQNSLANLLLLDRFRVKLEFLRLGFQ